MREPRLSPLGSSLNPDPSHPVLFDSQSLRGGAGQIDRAPLHIGPAVIDGNPDFLAILEIDHHGLRSQRQMAMGGGQAVLVEAFSAGGFLAVKAWPIPGGFSDVIHQFGRGGAPGAWHCPRPGSSLNPDPVVFLMWI